MDRGVYASDAHWQSDGGTHTPFPKPKPSLRVQMEKGLHPSSQTAEYDSFVVVEQLWR